MEMTQPGLPGTKGKPQEWSLREIVDALLHTLRTGGQWRMLPHDPPPWQTVRYHCRKWRLSGNGGKIKHLLSRELRQADGREATPGAAIVDVQSVKASLVKGK